jgi:uncharacterized protein (DUF433 family)
LDNGHHVQTKLTSPLFNLLPEECSLRLYRVALYFGSSVRYVDIISRLAGGHMRQLKRIKVNPQVMGGKPCIRNLRVTVGTIVGLIGAGRTMEDVLEAYPYLEREDILEALSYAAWRSEEIEVVLAS